MAAKTGWPEPKIAKSWSRFRLYRGGKERPDWKLEWEAWIAGERVDPVSPRDREIADLKGEVLADIYSAQQYGVPLEERLSVEDELEINRIAKQHYRNGFLRSGFKRWLRANWDRFKNGEMPTDEDVAGWAEKPLAEPAEPAVRQSHTPKPERPPEPLREALRPKPAPKVHDGPEPAGDGSVWIERGSPEHRAWEEFRGEKLPTTRYAKDRWWRLERTAFPTERDRLRAEIGDEAFEALEDAEVRDRPS